jgi:hypothetical protein
MYNNAIPKITTPKKNIEIGCGSAVTTTSCICFELLKN